MSAEHLEEDGWKRELMVLGHSHMNRQENNGFVALIGDDTRNLSNEINR